MKFVIQRVEHASVTVDNNVIGKINNGFMVLIGVENADTKEIADKMVSKLVNMRIFQDENDKMNLSLNDVNGEVMCVSQFTLYADIKKGRRPSFNLAANGSVSKPLYDYCVEYISSLGYDVKTGVFGADMKISLINDGPTTIIIDSEDLL